MINLLPTDKKSEIRAARTNLILIRYISIIVLAFTFILASMYMTYTVLGFTKKSSEDVIAANDVKAGVYKATQDQVNTLSASLAESKVLLDQETRYSKVLVAVGQQMPEGTFLDKLTLDSASLSGTPVTTKAYGKTAQDLTALRDRFSSSALFAGVTINTIVENDTAIDGYPATGDLTFTINGAAAK